MALHTPYNYFLDLTPTQLNKIIEEYNSIVAKEGG